ncbi:MAG: hypothetical protein IPI33_07130 [Dehalococcoidia bacterium]|nr:hypothetical protein [Dehalococcoidia bacterium]
MVFAERIRGAIPWKGVAENRYRTARASSPTRRKPWLHKRDTVKKVVISAPAKNEDLTTSSA